MEHEWKPSNRMSTLEKNVNHEIGFQSWDGDKNTNLKQDTG
jgi:hypothetical protein